MLTAADVMTREIVTVRKETTIRELAKIFAERRISSCPVVDDDRNLLGIVTESDLIEQDRSLHIPTVISLFDWVIYLESEKKFERELRRMTGQTVGEIFNEKVETVTPATPLNEIADLMSQAKLHALPVVEGRRVLGMVARIDLIRSMV